MNATVSEQKGLWGFGTRQVVYGAIGAALYGVLSWVTNAFPLPAAGNITFRPAVAVLIFFGIAFGPWVGFVSGLLGNVLGDAISGFGFWWHWSLGNGLIGLIAGLAILWVKDYRKPKDIALAVATGVVGNLIGLLFASVFEKITGGIDWSTAIVGYWLPSSVGNILVTIILVPILMIAYQAVLSRRSR
jgi:energy-coupling factor transport system substrate-specific component